MLENIIGGYEVKKGILVALVVLGLVMGICLSGLAGASIPPVTVVPRVTVQSGGSLSIVSGTSGELNLMEFGTVAPGSKTLMTLTLGVNANDVWTLRVSKDRDLKDDASGQTIPSASFTYTSNGPEGPTYITADTAFGSNGTPSNVASSSSAAGGCNVDVFYKLIVPAGQLKGYYTAPYHTYTLIVG